MELLSQFQRLDGWDCYVSLPLVAKKDVEDEFINRYSIPDETWD